MNQQNISKQIGENIAKKRKSTCLSLSAIACDSGISASRLEEIERGDSISAAEIYLLSVFYQCSPAEFMLSLSGFEDYEENSQTRELMQNFLKVDSPNRGQLFSDFISQFEEK